MKFCTDLAGIKKSRGSFDLAVKEISMSQCMSGEKMLSNETAYNPRKHEVKGDAYKDEISPPRRDRKLQF